MIDEIERELRASRLDCLDRIRARVEDYKECDQCRCVYLKRAGICSVCRGYRFKTDPAEVLATLNEMAQFAWPVGQGFVPRTERNPHSPCIPAFAPAEWDR